MKVGIISDVHGNDLALEAVIENMEKESIDGVIFLGDLIAGGPNPKKALELLRKLNVLSWINGNTDIKYQEVVNFTKLKHKENIELSEYYSYALKELCFKDIEFILTKPIKESICLERLDIMCVHGSPRDILEIMGKEIDKIKLMEMIEEVSEKFIICGHSHIPSMIEVEEKVIVNVGSVGFPIDEDNRASYVILNVNDPDYTLDFKRVEYDIEKILSQARNKKLPNLEKYEKIIKTGVYY